jgi:hypothetical protein
LSFKWKSFDLAGDLQKLNNYGLCEFPYLERLTWEALEIERIHYEGLSSLKSGLSAFGLFYFFPSLMNCIQSFLIDEEEVLRCMLPQNEDYFPRKEWQEFRNVFSVKQCEEVRLFYLRNIQKFQRYTVLNKGIIELWEFNFDSKSPISPL